ncbi:hypothetical protein KJ660_03010 [Candidatus Micrarchaeota archaeon]|nr:hypothetical protein [Candidatus Micrarchaeota archaeon]
MQKKLFISLILLIILVSPLALADGGLWIRDIDRWNLYDQQLQLASIDYKDGYQNMLIQINIDDEVHGDTAVWIFPVPAPPEKVAIDVTKGYPIFEGRNIKERLTSTVSGMSFLYAFYSTFPFSLVLIPLFTTMGSSGTYASSRFNEEYNMLFHTMDGGVTVHEVIEKMGITTELITTIDATSLSNYLTSKGLDLPESSKEIMNEYIGKDYSFVVSYINDIDKFKRWSTNTAAPSYYGYNDSGRLWRGNIMSVSLRFPTDKVFYPLRLTSVYGSKSIPMEINVAGHVSPELYPEIKTGSEITYNENTSSSSYYEGYKTFTKIKLNAPSKYFVKDLWISGMTPINVGWADFLINFPWLWGIVFYALLSCISSLAAGLFAFKEDFQKIGRNKLFFFGLFNFLTIVAFSVATWQLKTKTLDPKIKADLKKKGVEVSVKDNRKFVFVGLFIVIFLCLTFFSMALLGALL